MHGIARSSPNLKFQLPTAIREGEGDDGSLVA